MKLEDLVVEFYHRVRRSGYRGLLILLGNYKRVYRILNELGEYAKRRILVFWPGESIDYARTTLKGWDLVYYGHLAERLGEDYDIVAIDCYNSFKLSVIAAAGEMVRGGGILVLLAEGRWPSIKLPSVGYNLLNYVRRSLLQASTPTMVVNADTEEAITKTPMLKPIRRSRRVRCTNVPQWANRIIATEDQCRAVKAALELVNKPEASCIFITGDRGRGKSAAIGIALSILVARKLIGVVQVTSPSKYNVVSLFKFLIKGLQEASVPHKIIRVNDYMIVKGPWYKIEYIPPWQRPISSLVVVDEAAALGPARLRRVASLARKLIIISTVHGYEGSGKTLVHRILKQLPSPRVIELKEPIRYPPGDPLEDLIYNMLLLNVEPAEALNNIRVEDIKIVDVDSQTMSTDFNLLRQVYGVLSIAHYRNTPEDLARILEARSKIVAALTGDNVVGVIEYTFEPSRGSTMMSDILRNVYGVKSGRLVRIIRIAVHPKLQRRGIGTSLLKFLESKVKGYADAIGAVYSNPEVTRFWVRNHYAVVYISPRFNKVTGEKNIMVIKPLTPNGVDLVETLQCEIARRLALSMHSVYRDMAAEVLSDMLDTVYCKECRPIILLPDVLPFLNELCKNPEKLEQYFHIAFYIAVNALVCGALRRLSFSERQLIISAVLQGKGVHETARIFGYEANDVRRSVVTALCRLFNLLREHSVGFTSFKNFKCFDSS